jgi:predicted transposase YbfD/YdcC
VPADPSSSIPAALTHLARTDPVHLQDVDAPHLLTYLAAVPDPRTARGRRHALVAILGLAAAAVLAQRQVGGAPQEVPAFAPLLADLDLAGTVVTADALQTHPEAAEFLVGDKHAHYLFTVKANQPTLLARCTALAWHRVPVLDRTGDRGHGRVEVRTLKAVSVHRFGFPHAAQVLQVTRKTRAVHTPRRFKTVIVYAVTSLPFERASPAHLADLLRGHWAIEALHHIRDVTFAEDASQARTGAGPHVMATLRNLVIGVLCRAGPVKVAAALRRRAPPPRPRPTPTPGHPRHHARESYR